MQFVICKLQYSIDFGFFTRLKLSGLSKRTTTERLREEFQKFGEVVHGLFFIPNFMLKFDLFNGLLFYYVMMS